MGGCQSMPPVAPLPAKAEQTTPIASPSSSRSSSPDDSFSQQRRNRKAGEVVIYDSKPELQWWTKSSRTTRPEAHIPAFVLDQLNTSQRIVGGTPKTFVCEMVYVLGGAAVGKSTFIEEHFSSTHIVIDPDGFESDCPVNDSTPHAENSQTYAWCKKRASERMEEALSCQEEQSYVFPGTARNSAQSGCEASKVAYMKRAKEIGYRTRVVYLHCPIEVARARNSSRPRQLPDDIIVRTQRSAAEMYEVLKEICDEHEAHDVSAYCRARSKRRVSIQYTSRSDGHDVASVEDGAGDATLSESMRVVKPMALELDRTRLPRMRRASSFDASWARKASNKSLFVVASSSSEQQLDLSQEP